MGRTAKAPALPRVPAAERGATRIADRVVAKIAAQAAREVLKDAPGAHLVPPGRRPHASAAVRARSARIRLSVEFGYPNDVGGLCGSVRRHVGDRVGALTGMSVREVAVEVERLHTAVARGVDGGRAR